MHSGLKYMVLHIDGNVDVSGVEDTFGGVPNFLIVQLVYPKPLND